MNTHAHTKVVSFRHHSGVAAPKATASLSKSSVLFAHPAGEPASFQQSVAHAAICHTSTTTQRPFDERGNEEKMMAIEEEMIRDEKVFEGLPSRRRGGGPALLRVHSTTFVT